MIVVQFSEFRMYALFSSHNLHQRTLKWKKSQAGEAWLYFPQFHFHYGV